MRKGWKIFWIVCAVCLAVGFVCCSLSFAMGVTVEAIEKHFPNGIGWVAKGIRYHDDYDDNYEEHDYDEHEDEHTGEHDNTDDVADISQTLGTTIIEGSKKLSFDEICSIDVYVWGGEVYVKKALGTSKTISVETQNVDKRLKLRCYMDGNELELKTAERVVGINNSEVGKIYIYVPENFQFVEASINVPAGYLSIEDIQADELSVDVGAGEGKINKFTAHEADLECGAGGMTAVGTADVVVDIECGVGEITYTAGGKQNDYNYDLECGAGKIICGESTYSGLGVEEEINNHAAKEMNIDCGIGNIIVNFSEM